MSCASLGFSLGPSWPHDNDKKKVDDFNDTSSTRNSEYHAPTHPHTHKITNASLTCRQGNILAVYNDTSLNEIQEKGGKGKIEICKQA